MSSASASPSTKRSKPRKSDALAYIAAPLRPHAAPVDELNADPSNLRVHGERSIAAIKASLARFGQRKPIVVDAAGVTIAGAGTLEAARQLGWSHIAAMRFEDLSGSERTAFAIADNRTAELSEWDNDALHASIGTFDPELLNAAGYTQEELAVLLGDAQEVEQDEIPEPLPDAVTRRGDLWILGEQRLLCGDCTDAADIQRLMAGELAEIVVTDPPYLVDYDGTNHARGKGKNREGGKDWSGTYGFDWDDAEKNSDLYDRFVAAAMSHALQEHAPWYQWYASSRHSLVEAAWIKAGILPHAQIVWVKPVGVLTRTWYSWRHEPCLVGFKPAKLPKKLKDAPLMWEHEPCLMGWKKGNKPDRVEGQPYLSTVWQLDGFRGPDRPDHPTPKPLEVYAIPYRQHTRPGDVVYEPFSGSGTAIIVAEQMQRCCRALELQPVYIDVAVRRWQKLTGKAATLEGDGRSWAAVAKDRKVKTSPSA
jgi:DNA modification methylase